MNFDLMPFDLGAMTLTLEILWTLLCVQHIDATVANVEPVDYP